MPSPRPQSSRSAASRSVAGPSGRGAAGRRACRRRDGLTGPAAHVRHALRSATACGGPTTQGVIADRFPSWPGRPGRCPCAASGRMAAAAQSSGVMTAGDETAAPGHVTGAMAARQAVLAETGLHAPAETVGPDGGGPPALPPHAFNSLPRTELWLAPPTPATGAPHGAHPDAVRAWFDAATEAAIPSPDGTLGTAQAIAEGLARRAKAANTRRAYRAGVRAWCAWCDTHDLPPLPARPADVAAFLAAQRYVPAGTAEKPLATTTLKLRLAAIAYLHYLAGLPSPTTTADGHRDLCRARPGRPRGRRRTAAEAGGEDRSAARDPGADRRRPARTARPCAAAARLRRRVPPQRARPHRRRSIWRTASTDCASPCPPPRATGRARGCRSASPMASVICARCARLPAGVPSPASPPARCSAASGRCLGPRTRRPAGPRPTWSAPHAIDPGTVGRIVKARGAAAGFDRDALGGHSLKRGALNTAKDRRVHPAQLKQLGRHASYATLAAYIEEGDPFADNALNGVL